MNKTTGESYTDDISEVGGGCQEQEGVSAGGDITFYSQQVRRITQKENKSVQKCLRKRKRVPMGKCREVEEWSSSGSTSSEDECSGKSSAKKRSRQNLDAYHFVILKGKELQGIHKDPVYVTVKPYSESNYLEVQSDRSTPELIAEMCAASPTHSSKIFTYEERLKEKEDGVHRKEGQGKSLPKTIARNIVTQGPSLSINPSCLTLLKGNVNHGAYEGNPFVSVNPDSEEHYLTGLTKNTLHNTHHIDEEIELLEKLYEKFKDILERTKKMIACLKKRRERQQREHEMRPASGGAGGDFGKRGGNQDGRDPNDRETYNSNSGNPPMQFPQGNSSSMDKCPQDFCALSQAELCSIDSKAKRVLSYDNLSKKFDQLTSENLSIHDKNNYRSTFLKIAQESRNCECTQAPSSINSLEGLSRNTDLPKLGQEISEIGDQEQRDQLYENRKETRETTKHIDVEIMSTHQQCQVNSVNKSGNLEDETVEKELGIPHDKRKEHEESTCAFEQNMNLDKVILNRSALSTSQDACRSTESQDISIIFSPVSDPGPERTLIHNQSTSSSSIIANGEPVSMEETLSEEFASCVQEEIIRNSEHAVNYVNTVENSVKADSLNKNLVKPCSTNNKRKQRGCKKLHMVNNLYKVQNSQQQSKDESFNTACLSSDEDLADRLVKTPRKISIPLNDININSKDDGDDFIIEADFIEENVENNPPTQAISSIAASEAESEYFTPHSTPESSTSILPKNVAVFSDVETTPKKFLSQQQFGQETYDIYR
ncbi:uncharacterized protein LOC143038429 isoform X3 [Oratosquilla oratoria]|uniref:uncharacterized protein LOC143038429 isoform X3 n=1 Tax=Oratosquilla oratoria TaxID=337810 RepID=UPI003F76D096